MERTKPRINPVLGICSFARAKAAREPTTSDRIVVEAATARLFAIILKNGWLSKIAT